MVSGAEAGPSRSGPGHEGRAAQPLLDRLLPLGGWAGLAIFVVFNLAVMILVLRDPDARSVVPVYREGALGWWRGEDIFGSGIGGFIYLPSFAVLYTPFALLGPQIGDALWRLVSVGALAFAVWQAIKLALPEAEGRKRLLVFGAALLLLMPSAFGAFRNGQATTLLMALMLLAAVMIAEARWWWAAVLLGLAFALKPLAIVYMLLVGVLYPKLGWRMIVVTIGLVLLPLINPDIAGAWHLYGLGIKKVLAAGAPTEGHWADITALLDRIGLPLQDRALTIIRLVCAVLALGLAFVTYRRDGRADAGINILAIAVVYLMLMNPRAEGNTYVMLGVVIALYAEVVWHRERRAGATWYLVAIAASFLFSAIAFRYTNLWLQPLLCVIFAPFLIARCLAPPRLAPDPRAGG